MSTARIEKLTPTSHAMLGLLSLRSWTTYELANQMRRSVSWFWPRAERKLYDEPKRLAALGLADARTEMTGKRASTIYDITPEGRRHLRAWIEQSEFAPPQIEMEAMIHLFFADSGSPDAATDTLREMRRQADEAIGALAVMAASLSGDGDEFPDRRAMNAVTMELYVRLHETIRDWSHWAETEMNAWPPVRRRRRKVLIGPRQRGSSLFTSIAERVAPARSSSGSEPPD